MARAITLVLVPRHSTENRSKGTQFNAIFGNNSCIDLVGWPNQWPFQCNLQRIQTKGNNTERNLVFFQNGACSSAMRATKSVKRSGGKCTRKILYFGFFIARSRIPFPLFRCRFYGIVSKSTIERFSIECRK